MILQVLEFNLIIHVIQDENKKFINFLTCICDDEISLSSILIYKRKSQVFQDIWLKKLKMKNEVFFVTSTNE